MSSKSVLVQSQSPRGILETITKAHSQIDLDEDDIKHTCAEFAEACDAINAAFAQINYICKPRTIKTENAKWAEAYDPTSREKLLVALKTMRDKKDSFGESIKGIVSAMDTSVEMYKEQVNVLKNHLFSLQQSLDSGPYQVEKMVAMARLKGAARNLGYPGPVQMLQALRDFQGDLVPPAGLVESYHQEWLHAIPASEQVEKTGTSKALGEFLDPMPSGYNDVFQFGDRSQKWAANITAGIKKHPNNLYGDIRVYKLVRLAYAPADAATVTPAGEETEFWKQQSDPRWWSIEYITSELQAEQEQRQRQHLKQEQEKQQQQLQEEAKKAKKTKKKAVAEEKEEVVDAEGATEPIEEPEQKEEVQVTDKSG